MTIVALKGEYGHDISRVVRVERLESDEDSCYDPAHNYQRPIPIVPTKGICRWSLPLFHADVTMQMGITNGICRWHRKMVITTGISTTGSVQLVGF